MSDQPGDRAKGSFADLFEQASAEVPKRKKTFAVGEKIEVTIAQIGATSVFADLDGKRQGIFDRAQLIAPSGELVVRAGERLRAFVLGVDDNGNVRLGRAADRPDGVAALEEAAASGLPLT
ncbi:MAG: RNA-binding protein, partial [Deltaproteobacteria bacterium]|nr:RNA-binding protein [Deltaproteobacteria bacterium]